MRMIKFRGWSRMAPEWIYGYYEKVSGQEWIVRDCGVAGWQRTAIESGTAAQLIGYDFNGLEVYEGDRIKPGGTTNDYAFEATAADSLTVGKCELVK